MERQVVPAGCPEPVGLITAELLKYGLPGLAVLVLIFVVVFLFKRSEKRDEDHRTALEAKDKENSAEVATLRAQIEALVQRHMGKAETWIEKSQDLSARLNSFLETIAREVRERAGDRGFDLQAFMRETRETLLRDIRETIVREIRSNRDNRR